MTAAETLARWREVEEGATTDTIASSHDDDAVRWSIESDRPTYDALMQSREAMPALLAFAEAVLSLHAPMDMLHVTPDGLGRVVKVCVACGDDSHETAYPCPTVRLAQHLGAVRPEDPR